MSMDFSRIQSVVDVSRTVKKRACVVGVGGSVTLISDLCRCGVSAFTLVDPDRIELSNVARQDHLADQLGEYKVDAVARNLKRINPEVRVTPLAVDFCALNDADIDHFFSETDLFVFATDSFPAQARGNEVALRLRKPAVWIGLYEEGRAGEVIFWHAGIDCCFRCLCASRYAAHETDAVPPITSRGATIFDIRLPDAIAGMIVLGLLTRGANNRFGRLIEQLGDRNFLQVKIDPTYSWNGRDIFREQLCIPDDCAPYFSFVTIARRDPEGGRLYCPDCERFRGHMFENTSAGPVRIYHSSLPATAPAKECEVNSLVFG